MSGHGAVDRALEAMKHAENCTSEILEMVDSGYPGGSSQAWQRVGRAMTALSAVMGEVAAAFAELHKELDKELES